MHYTYRHAPIDTPVLTNYVKETLSVKYINLYSQKQSDELKLPGTENLHRHPLFFF